MNLDKRIESIDDIWNTFNSISCNQFVNTGGYFSSELENFSDLSKCPHGTLEFIAATLNNPYPYRIKETGALYRFFLPDIAVKDEEPKFRPFNLHEFLVQFPVGTIIIFRHKDGSNSYTLIFAGYEETNEENICLGCCWYSLQELAEEYEYKSTTGEWLAFGVKEL